MSARHPVRPARQAVAAIFLLNGLLFGSWAARIPAVRDRLTLSDGELGLALACVAAGSLLSMPLAGAAGPRRARRSRSSAWPRGPWRSRRRSGSCAS